MPYCRPYRYKAWISAAALLHAAINPVFAQSRRYHWSTFTGNQSGQGNGNGTGVAAHFDTPSAIAVDNDGNFVVVDRGNRIIRRITPVGVVTTVAGRNDGFAEHADGFGRDAEFHSPEVVAVDRHGILFISDSGSHTIRTIGLDGRVATIAGIPGSPGSADGLRSEATFRNPTGLAFDDAGNLYIADSGNHTIRRMSVNGEVTTFAGTSGGFGGRNDGVGPAASFWSPGRLAWDRTGRLLVADSRNHTIRAITLDRSVTTLTGRAPNSGSTDGVLPNARFYEPGGMVVASDATIYVADSGNHTIRRISADGMVSTVAGIAGANSFADGPGSTARFYGPADVTIGIDGRLFVIDGINDAVRSLTNGGDVTTVAGGIMQRGSTDGTGLTARFWNPGGVAISANGTLYVADTNNHTIRMVSPEGVTSTLAGSPGSAGSANGAGSNARFKEPTGIAVDNSGTVYVSDTGNHTIRKITAGGIVSTLAGTAGSEGTANGTGSAARFRFPRGIAVDRNATLYVADSRSHQIRRITAAGVVTSFAGLANTSGDANGTGTAARFSTPTGVAVDSNGNLFVADNGNRYIRRITSGGTVTYFPEDGRGTLPNGSPFNGFYSPRGIGVDSFGTVFVVDTSGATVSTITNSEVVEAIGGLELTPGIGDGTGQWARFAVPDAVAVSSTGEVYVADAGNHRIVRGVIDAATLPPVFSEPAAQSVISGPVPISFVLPEPALADSLKLIFAGSSSRTLTLAGFLEADGPHQFAFDPQSPSLSPMIAAITGGTDIPPGNYAVTLTYQDEAGNQAAAIVIENVVIGSPEISLLEDGESGAEITDGQTVLVNFGRNVQGTPGVLPFTIRNIGSTELLVSGASAPAGYQFLNLPTLPLTVGIGQSVDFQISLSTLTVGTHTGLVVITSDDLDESELEFPLIGEVFIPDPVATVPASTTALNRQTGLREQTIHIANDTTATVPAYNLIIRGLPEGVEVNNASGRREDGSWVVYVRQTVNPHSSQDILLEYFSTNRGPVEIAPQVSTEVVLNPPDLAVPGAPGFVIDRVVQLAGGAVLIEFPTTPGRQYQVQYSHDGTNWQASPPNIRAAASRTQWLDRGLPRTDSHPFTHASRFYRVAELAP